MRIVPILFAAAGLVACGRSSSNNNHPDSPAGSDSGGGGGYTIQQVQNDMMAPGTAVTLHGVVVTAIDNFGGKMGNVWVEEPEGGPFSGVLIYKADPNAVAALQPGDIVDVTNAVKSEFALMGANADPTGRTDTELEPPASGQTVTITKTGSGMVPAPATVDALAIGQMSDADSQGPMFSAAWEQWEGVLVTVTNVSALSAPKSFGSTMPAPLDNYDMSITGVVKLESSLADFPKDGMGNFTIHRGDCLGSVTGVVDYFYDYLLLPRQTSDIATGGTACPAPENSMALCTDTMDNDGNGFADCADDGCIVAYGPGAGTCRSVVTVASVDQAADTNPTMPTFPSTGVEVDNAYITAIAGTNFWISSSPTAAADGGLYVFGNGNPLPTGAVIGKQINLMGTLKAYNNDMMGEVLPEFTMLQGTVGGAATVVPVAKPFTSASTLVAAAGGRPYVGSLVRITDVTNKFKVTAAETSANHYTGTLTEGSTTFNILGDVFQDTDAVNACYSSIEGVWTYDIYNNVYAIELTGAPTAATGCP